MICFMPLTAKEVTIKYKSKKKGETTVISKMNAVFPSCSLNVVLGPSGCGKTTLLKAIAGLVDYEGDFYADGTKLRDVPLNKLGLSYVPQEVKLYPFWTVFDNIAFPLKLRKTPREELLGSVRGIANEMGISSCLNVRPRFISEGQRQRVMLARELVFNPKLLLFDEPLSSLDPSSKEEICSLLKEYQNEHQATILYVTHSFREAMLLADRLFLMEHGEFVASDTPYHLLNQSNAYLKSMEESEKMGGEK